jgi:glycosyltransferase involved in cell wall biosynthesis
LPRLTDPFFVSVIMPAYNTAAFIPDAVESIRRQAYPRLELIIVDDGSTDGTAEVSKGLTGLSVQYVYQPNGGPAQARNHGLRLARGQVIAFLDADDLWPADRLSCQLPYLERDPLTDVVLGRIQCFHSMPRADGGSEMQICSPAFVLLSPTTALFRRRVFERVGGFDEAMRYGEDTDWFMRAREQRVPMVVHDDVTVLYRRHQNNMTRGRDAKELHVLSVLKKSLDRRRQQQGTAHSLPSVFDFVDRAGRPDDPSSPPEDT